MGASAEASEYVTMTFKNVARHVAAKCGGHNLNGFEVIHFSSRGRLQNQPPPGLNRVNQF